MTIAAASCCALGGVMMLTLLTLVLVYVFAREREPGAATYPSAIGWLGLAPGLLCLAAMLVHGAIAFRHTPWSLARRAYRRLTPWRRHGTGATSHPGAWSPATSTSKPPRWTGAHTGHSVARRQLTSIIYRAICSGAPPWVSLLLLIHWPVAMLFEIFSSLISGRFTTSPLAWLIGPDYETTD